MNTLRRFFNDLAAGLSDPLFVLYLFGVGVTVLLGVLAACRFAADLGENQWAIMMLFGLRLVPPQTTSYPG